MLDGKQVSWEIQQKKNTKKYCELKFLDSVSEEKHPSFPLFLSTPSILQAIKHFSKVYDILLLNICDITMHLQEIFNFESTHVRK